MKKINSKTKRIVISSLLALVIIGTLAIPAVAGNNVIAAGVSKVENVLHPDDHAKKVERKEEVPPVFKH
ncbi:MAG: hypothetical protein A2189_01050 [Paenibacillus sp. RIFOXYA1_FULL_44_5]|nr:MAG: hypothetical protein A2189_01050 [Paenibacillus sp. RIFOXYA1_FULL_44_5]